jgi:hypothetical protein
MAAKIAFLKLKQEPNLIIDPQYSTKTKQTQNTDYEIFNTQGEFICVFYIYFTHQENH